MLIQKLYFEFMRLLEPGLLCWWLHYWHVFLGAQHLHDYRSITPYARIDQIVLFAGQTQCGPSLESKVHSHEGNADTFDT